MQLNVKYEIASVNGSTCIDHIIANCLYNIINLAVYIISFRIGHAYVIKSYMC